MLAGALIKLPENINVADLNGLVWAREENGIQVRSVIQFQEYSQMGENLRAQAALVIHQQIGTEKFLDNSDGRYFVNSRDTIMTSWADIHAVMGLIIVDSVSSRTFVREIINKGLNLASNAAHEVYLDTEKMARDHPDQWTRAFSDRIGRVDRGTVYGDSVELDSVFGPEFGRSRSQSVGWYTNFFGAPTKVRVSPRGSIVVWSWPSLDRFVAFIQKEVMPYMISL